MNNTSVSSTTWKRSRDTKGSEPDSCYYVAHAAQISGKRTIDLDVDPPPDIVIEIDATNDLRQLLRRLGFEERIRGSVLPYPARVVI